MNARRAKALRRAAQTATVGLPERRYRRDTKGVIWLHQCTRQVYRAMKQGKA